MAIKLKANAIIGLVFTLATLFVLDGTTDPNKEANGGGLLSFKNWVGVGVGGHRNLRYQDLLAIQDKDYSPSAWRILNLGSSVSWGEGMRSRFNAYPYLLSPNVTNLASLTQQGPHYPSVCTQSMVGDDAIYDLIILEFYHKASDGLLLLTKRLRQRFPKATIVIIRQWNPLMLYYQNKLPLNKWSKLKRLGIHAPELREVLYSNSQAEDWSLADEEELRAIQDQAVKDYGAILYELPFDKQDPRESIAEHSNWFSQDEYHLSVEGHAVVANGILQVLREKGVTVQRHDEVGSWGEGDSCDVTWHYADDSKNSLEKSQNIEFKNFAPFKYALQIPPVHNAHFSIYNPFDQPRELVLSYMATNPPGKYPTTKVYLKKEGDELWYRGMDLEPSIKDYQGNEDVEVEIELSTSLGMVPPGKTAVHLRTGEGSVEYPFRIVGYAITNERVASSVM